MYSGSDSTESQNYGQWTMNASSYQNMSNEQVDWAALAQQWIIMKEAGPPPVIPTEQKPKPKVVQLNEGGEAPMEVENEKEEPPSEWNSAPNQPPVNEWNWNTQNQTWGWGNPWTPPTGVPPPMKPPLLPTPGNFNHYSAPPESGSDNANFSGYTSNTNNDYSPGYWSTTGSSKQMKPHNRRFSKINVPRPPVQPAVPPETQPTLDANKRKQLPAWIREGLEKMERDKQKQLEKEKEKLEREEYNEKLKQSEKETMEILKTTIREQQQKSKFESDGENSDSDYGDRKKRTRTPEPALTAEEQMMNVRRTMTEILLKVTNREIESICKEELQRYHKKRKASDQRVSAPSGANVTAKLGLGIYGGESGSSASEDSEPEYENRRDSDAELKDSIRRKKAEFSKTEREIEDKLAEAEQRKQDGGSRSPSADTNDNDTQAPANNHRHRRHTQNPRRNVKDPRRRRVRRTNHANAVPPAVAAVGAENLHRRNPPRRDAEAVRPHRVELQRNHDEKVRNRNDPDHDRRRDEKTRPVAAVRDDTREDRGRGRDRSRLRRTEDSREDRGRGREGDRREVRIRAEAIEGRDRDRDRDLEAGGGGRDRRVAGGVRGRAGVEWMVLLLLIRRRCRSKEDEILKLFITIFIFFK